VSATVDRLTALLGEATAGGDWEWNGIGMVWPRGTVPEICTTETKADAELIAAAVSSLPALLAVAEAAEAWVDAATDDPGLWAGDEDWTLIRSVAGLAALDGGTGGAG
jgi:hypothetical protein